MLAAFLCYEDSPILKVTGVFYIWPACDVLMSLACINMSGRGEVAKLVSFSIHMSKLYKRTKWQT